MSAEPKVLMSQESTLNRKKKSSTSASFESFRDRHFGPGPEQIEKMLSVIGVSSLEDFVNKIVPASIFRKAPLNLPEAKSEYEMLAELKAIAGRNKVFQSYIGLGFSNTITPAVILRNILENPGWYTQYTPYQAEISQGRLEALLNFQTMVMDLTGMPLANASLLDEGTAAAEALTLCKRVSEDDSRQRFFVSDTVHRPTVEVLQARAEPLGIEIIVGDHQTVPLDATYFGAIVQYPATDGVVNDYRSFAERAHEKGILLVAAADILSLAILTPPGEWGADVVVGNTQRFGVPLGFGGPHAAFLAAKDEFRREIPGRVVGVSRDSAGKPAYRLALQTREQHIRRERATSNICTAQVLLAVIASMYAVYHGPHGIRSIAERVRRLSLALAKGLKELGVELQHDAFFDTLRTKPLGNACSEIVSQAEKLEVNFRVYDDRSLGISLDETVLVEDVQQILKIFSRGNLRVPNVETLLSQVSSALPRGLQRKSDYLTHPVFNSYHSETEILRYITRLQSRDLSLTAAMIPLGSCTMKLNATSEMIPVTWPEFGQIHPYVPASQAEGYLQLFRELEQMIAEVTGLPAVSLQPNSGSQGEYAGLLVIRAFHRNIGQAHRTVCLIPQSAHGTNPASAALAGMDIVQVACDERGNVDAADLHAKAEQHREKLAALMITYPSTHGVFEEGVRELSDIVHRYGGLVYMDGANMNAQVGLCRPGDFGVDVCHLNLHKTFCIPHGGGGPGMGPIAVNAELAAYLPGHVYANLGVKCPTKAVCSAPWGSASILTISWAYARMMGPDGLRMASVIAMLNANYVSKRLEPYFPTLYRGAQGFIAHECILDLRNFKRSIGIEVADVAKRLMDYGFHAPTVSFPVVETLMVEPTESESKEELDRFCEAMIAIRGEIADVEKGKSDKYDNPLKNAPHTATAVCSDTWNHTYSREQAAYPMSSLRDYKFWPAVGRIDSAFGDRNFFCSCVPWSETETE